MELETVNKLYLELSQFATARTAKEIALEAAVARRGRLIQEIFNSEECHLTADLISRASEELTLPALRPNAWNQATREAGSPALNCWAAKEETCAPKI